jgi:hypothetical protein
VTPISLLLIIFKAVMLVILTAVKNWNEVGISGLVVAGHGNVTTFLADMCAQL